MKRLVENFLVGGLVCLAAGVRADEWFADASRPAGTGDGMSEKTAFHTIQEAVDAAATGDTVTVLPGVYDEGGWVDEGGYTNRVHISRQITLRSKNLDRENTVILGAHDANGCYLNKGTTGTHYNFMGPAAVRGILVESAAKGTRIEGFTIRKGAVHEVASGDNAYTTGGGVFVKGARRDVYIADCLLTDCVATRGGALRYGTAIRCHFDRNNAYYGDGCVAREANLYNSLLTRNGNKGTGSTQLWSCSLANCTVSQNQIGACFSACTLVNTLECYNGYPTGVNGSGLSVATNSLVASLRHPSQGYDFFKDASLDVSEVGSEDYPFIAPARGDFRLRNATTAASYGDSALVNSLFTVPDEDANLDFAGAAIPTSGAVAVGCHQTTVEPAGGAWRFLTYAVVDGWETGVGNLWCYATTPNQCFRAECVCGEGEYPFCYQTSYNIRWPQPDGAVWLMAPPAEKGFCNVYAWTATNVLWVAKDGKDTNVGRTRATAFKSIQAAIDAAPTLPDSMPTDLRYRTIIRVAEGVYGPEDGTTEYQGQKNTLYVDHKWLLVIGEDGPEKCVITGASDPDAAATEYGCGPNAVRCLSCAKSTFAFQRFTFTGGHTVSFTGSGYGGLIRGYSRDYSQIIDSVITNCVGNRGSVIFVGSMNRCCIRDCPDYYGYVRSGDARNCLFEIVKTQTKSGFIGQDEYAYGCTFSSPDDANARAYAFAGTNATGWCNIHYRAYPNTSATNMDGNVYYDSGAVPSADEHATKADPKFADVANGDYRLLSDSPAFGAGTTESDYWLFAGGDIYGNPPRIVNGRPTPGAVQSVVTAKLTVKTPSEGTLEPSGTVLLAPGESVTLRYTPGARNTLGFLVNGETQAVETASWKVTAPAFDPGASSGQDISILYSPHWYVSPTGSNANNGWTTNAPFATLAYAMSLATNRGDVVHALAGAYTNGFARLPLQSGQAASTVNLRVRVAVPDYVSLVSEEGPEKTFIVGAKDPDSTKYDGCGSNAVKCVYLANSSSVKGFTICGGRVTGDSGEDVNSAGGGVFSLNTGKSDYAGLVENCILSNNYGRSGAATYRGWIVGCQILENHAYSSAPVGRYSNLYGCYIDRNYGSPTYQIYYALENCTFGPSNLQWNGTTSTSLLVCKQPQNDVSGKLAVAKNCVFMDRVQTSGENVVLATNSVFRNDTASYYPTDEAHRLGCRLMSVDAMKMKTGTCIPAVDSPLTDAADETLMSAPAKRIDASCATAAGGQRVYNGCADIGAFEHDWRSDYAAILGAASVEKADPAVVGAVGGNSVTIGAGELSLTMEGLSGSRNTYTIPVTFENGGSVAISMDGVSQGVFLRDETGPNWSLVRSSHEAATTFDFVYDGDPEGVTLSQISRTTKGLILMIR